MRFFLVFVSVLTLMVKSALFSEEKNLNHYYEIAKQNCHDISAIRIEMDRINNAILQLLTERTAYVQRAGDLKSRTTKIADDRQRVADQEKKITDKSNQLGLPLEVSLPSFRAIVENSILYQQNYINRLP